MPQVGLQIPLWGLVFIMVAWGAYSVFTYRLGTRALKKRQLAGLPNMVDTRGEVVSPLAPEGLVRIKGELWLAKSADGEMKPGRKIIVVGQERLKLLVRQSNLDDNFENTE